MTMNGHGGSLPTRRDKFWYRLGFVTRADRIPNTVGMVGAITVQARLKFGLADRLRLLVSGDLHTTVTVFTREKVDGAVPHFAWRIRAPGEI